MKHNLSALVSLMALSQGRGRMIRSHEPRTCTKCQTRYHEGGECPKCRNRGFKV